MKARKGFISNSSSSSFIIATKKEIELSKDLLIEAFQTPTTSPLFPLVVSMAEVFINNAEKYSNLKEYCKEIYTTDIENVSDEIISYFEKGYIVYQGRTSSEGDLEEMILTDIGLDYESDKIIIKKEAGY